MHGTSLAAVGGTRMLDGVLHLTDGPVDHARGERSHLLCANGAAAGRILHVLVRHAWKRPVSPAPFLPNPIDSQ
ncbi:MAG: hypothetical protein WCS09_01820 [Pseudomonadota bacterium]